MTVDRLPATRRTSPFSREEEDFSLVIGGPLYQLFLRARMAQPSMALVHRRIVAFAFITWVPLAVLALLGGTFVGNAKVPFVVDLGPHVLFLLSVPLLIAAEVVVHRRIRIVVMQFVERGLIAPDDRPRFDAFIAQAMRLRNSYAAEIVLILISFTFGNWLWRTQMILPVATWYALPVDGSIHLRWAGYWLGFVSLPISRFILLRWYFRLFIWYVFLARTSRLRLRLNAMHPDRAGGLGFLTASVDAFSPVLIAQTVFLSGVIGNQIWHQGATLPSFKYVILAAIACLTLVVLLPLAFFALQLSGARRVGLLQCGLLASRYVAEFRKKWMNDHNQAGDPHHDATEPLIGTADIQSLADLANSYDVVREMGMLPFGRRQVIRIAVLLAVPLLPLILTMIPFDELIGRLLRLAL